MSAERLTLRSIEIAERFLYSLPQTSGVIDVTHDPVYHMLGIDLQLWRRFKLWTFKFLRTDPLGQIRLPEGREAWGCTGLIIYDYRSDFLVSCSLSAYKKYIQEVGNVSTDIHTIKALIDPRSREVHKAGATLPEIATQVV